MGHLAFAGEPVCVFVFEFVCLLFPFAFDFEFAEKEKYPGARVFPVRGNKK